MSNSNPWINVAAVKEKGLQVGEIKLGKPGKILLTIGNAGTGTIPKEALEITLSSGENSRLSSLSKVKKSAWKDFTVTVLSKDKVNNYMKLVNKRAFNEFDLSQVLINVLPVKKGGPALIGAHVAYRFLKDAEGKFLSEAGDTSPADNNSSTSLKVV